MTLDEYVKRSQVYIASGGLDEHEIDYKVDIGKQLAKVRAVVLEGASDWPDRVKRMYSQNRMNFVRFNDVYPLKDWIDTKQDEALEALQALWAKPDTSISDRLEAFIPRVPDPTDTRYPFHGGNKAWTRLRLLSALLMALDPTKYPPCAKEVFTEAYKRTGYDIPPNDAGEVTVYEHALGFLDKIVKSAAAQGFARPSNGLEAQSLLWAAKEGRWGGIEEVPDPPEPIPDDPAPETVSLQVLADELMFPVKFLERVEKLLEDKRQVIFQGPPGTGKTYTAKKLAACLAGSEERVRLVQFHPSYAYEDFVQGYRPKLINGQPGFELKDGPLREMAEMARQHPDQKHFLVIDEINRGNLAKVFGELYFLLEYRGEEMRLQYSESGETFAMPRNLYIIGTMNTADRSIALVDLALRRRFYFVEFHPDEWPVEGLLHRWLEANNSDMEWAADIVDRANKLLADREAAIGPSYLMKDSLDEDMAQLIWEHNVLPYVEEHLYGQTDRLKEFDFDSLRGRGGSDGESDEGGGDGEDDESVAGSDDA